MITERPSIARRESRLRLLLEDLAVETFATVEVPEPSCEDVTSTAQETTNPQVLYCGRPLTNVCVTIMNPNTCLNQNSCGVACERPQEPDREEDDDRERPVP